MQTAVKPPVSEVWQGFFLLFAKWIMNEPQTNKSAFRLTNTNKSGINKSVSIQLPFTNKQGSHTRDNTEKHPWLPVFFLELYNKLCMTIIFFSLCVSPLWRWCENNLTEQTSPTLCTVKSLLSELKKIKINKHSRHIKTGCRSYEECRFVDTQSPGDHQFAAD